MTLEKAKETILNHMKKGETEEALNILLDAAKAHRADLYDESVLLASKLRHWERDRMLGTAGSESLSVRKARIDEALINLTLQLTEPPEDESSRPDSSNAKRYRTPLLALGILLIVGITYLSIRPGSRPSEKTAANMETSPVPETDRSYSAPTRSNNEKRPADNNAPSKAEEEPSGSQDQLPAAKEETAESGSPALAETPADAVMNEEMIWGSQLLTSDRDALRFLLKTGGYTTEVTQVEMAAATRGNTTGLLAFFRSEPGGVRGNWGVEKRQHPDEVTRLLNGSFRKIEEVEITVHHQNGTPEFTIFSQPGTRRNAPSWQWQRLSTPGEVLRLLNGGAGTIRQAEIATTRQNDQLNFFVFYQSGQPLVSGKWKAQQFNSEREAQRFLSRPDIRQADVSAAAGSNAKPEIYLFYQ